MIKRKSGHFLRDFRNNSGFLVMLLPAIIYILIFAYLPMSGIILAFKRYTFDGGVFGSPLNGLANFEFFFMSGRAWLVTRNTVLYNLLFIAFNTTLQLTIAILISELAGKYFKKITQTMMFLPYFISWVVVSVIAFNLLSFDVGVINAVIKAFGGEPISFYTESGHWPAILTLFGGWKGVG